MRGCAVDRFSKPRINSCKWEFLLLVLLVGTVLGCESKKSSSASAGASTSQSNPAPQAAQPVLNAQPQGPELHVDPQRAMTYVKEIVAFGPRWPGSKGQEKVAGYLRNKFKGDHLEEDAFVADTPAGRLSMRNFIAKFDGTKDGIILLGSHIDTLYPLQENNYIGANDGGSSIGLLIAIADQLRGKKLEGYSIWLAFFDGEEAVEKWTDTDSDYGSRHLAAK